MHPCHPLLWPRPDEYVGTPTYTRLPNCGLLFIFISRLCKKNEKKVMFILRWNVGWCEFNTVLKWEFRGVDGGRYEIWRQLNTRVTFRREPLSRITFSTTHSHSKPQPPSFSLSFKSYHASCSSPLIVTMQCLNPLLKFNLVPALLVHFSELYGKIKLVENK